ncbi:MAG TPA: 4-(cytidine 5'-diphospho)-2-C-methyl-D-erythritol kinase [Gaiellales bacterium]
MSALAPAKINLVLRVGPRRPDGFHELASLVVALDVGDLIELEPAAQTSVDAPGLPGGDTLVRTALDLLVERAGAGHGFAVRLDKRLPVAAGLGGGSSDAGVALRLANALLPAPLADDVLLAVAAEVGSDVPFFAAGVAAAGMYGRGAIVRPLRLHAAPFVALAWPGEPVSTAAVYGAYRSAWGETGFARASESVALAARADLPTLAGLVANDLQDRAEQLCPASAALRRRLRERGALAACVSGSGSAVFGLFDDREAARTALEGLPGAAWSAVAGVLDPATMAPS